MRLDARALGGQTGRGAPWRPRPARRQERRPTAAARRHRAASAKL